MTTTATIRLAPRRAEDVTASVPVTDAAVCPDCDVIFCASLGHCPRCAGRVIHRLIKGA